MRITTSKSKMKKVTFLMALAVAAGMASCTAQSPKADLKTDIDSLSYACLLYTSYYGP